MAIPSWKYWLLLAMIPASVGGSTVLSGLRVAPKAPAPLLPAPISFHVDLGAVEAELELLEGQLAVLAERVASDTSIVYLQVVRGDAGVVVKIIDPDHRIRLVK